MELSTGLAAVTVPASAIGLAAISWTVYRRRDEPGMLAFSTMTAVLASLAVAIVAVTAVGALGLLEDPTVSDFMPVGTIGYLVAIPWLVFVLQYTGHGGLVTRQRLGWLAAFSVVHVFFMSAYQFVVPAGQMFPEDFSSLSVMVVFGVAFMTLLTMIGFYAIGALLLLRTTYTYSHMSTGMGFLLAAPALSMIPLWTYLPQIGLGYGRPAVGVFAGAVLLFTTLCFGAVVRYDEAFGSTSAAAGPVGRETILRQQNAAVFTLDNEHRIVELNDAARRTFGLAEQSPLGEPIESVLDATVEELTTDATLSVRTVDDLWSETTAFLDTADGRRRFDTEVTDLTDERGRHLGLVVHLEDVTERALREQRIGILNRVLRHNLRNKLSIVRGHAEMVPDAEGDLEEYAAAIESAATDLLSLGERARDVERVLAVEEQGSAPVAAVAESVIESQRRCCDETAFSVEVDGDYEVATTSDALEYVLTELCENAAKHNDAADSRVTVRSERDDDWVSIDVVDNGPELSQQELVAVRDEAESPLEHGSGLGLWSVRWIVTAFGGEIAVEDNEPRGTVVTITLPVADSDAVEESVGRPLPPEEFAAAVEQ